MFKPVKNPPDFPAMDHDTLNFWRDKRIFERSMEEREGGNDYVFYDGPPGTNGPPHIGHIMQSALKDLWPRFWTMKGYRVLRKAGWDTHGLPVEMTADRELNLENKQAVQSYGVQEYVDYCRSIVFRFKGEWEKAIRRLGRFLDLENFYATYTQSFIQSDWWVLKQAWNTTVSDEHKRESNLFGRDRLLYKDYRISAWDPKQGTTLSNFEVAQGYKEVVEIALFPKFRIVGEENTYLTAWTTTAWTLLSNIAIAVGPEIDYLRIVADQDSKAAKAGERIWIAKDRHEDLKPFLGKHHVDGEAKGRDLAGLQYEPLWDWQRLDENEKGHVVIADEYVTTDDGTGM
ncbi:class I tRNA ligase family protein, partial [bacterium]|nr:class I tRNA ligase family protein [bacterium]